MMMPAPKTSLLLPVLLGAAATAQSSWSVPVLETALNTTAADSGPHLSFDRLTLHLASFSAGNWEIYTATRPYVGGPWSARTPVTELSDPAATDDQPFLAVGDVEILFGSTRAGGLGGFDILRSTRAAPGQPWSAPAFVTELNSSGSESSPSMTADGLEVFFLSTGWGAPAAPNNSIFHATRTSTTAPFGAPTLVAELHTGNTHRDCEISTDGLRIVFTEFVSPRLKVFYAERPDTSSPFAAPIVWTEFDTVGTATGVFSFTLSSTGDEAFLAAGFPAASGGQEIMSTRRALFYGSGCGAPFPLALVCNTPVLGASWDFTTTDIDPVSPIAVTFFGNLPAAIPLAAIGAPGCFANIDTLAGSLTAANSGGTATAGFLLPATPSLSGSSAVAQSVCLTVSNALGVLTSNGVQGTLGL